MLLHRVLRSIAATALVTVSVCGVLPAQGATIATARFDPRLHVNLKASKQTPTGLYYRDLVIGKGAVVKAGALVSVKYAGTLADGTKVDATAAGGAPITFPVGQGSVIEGWDQGLVGMRVGGKRQLIIPPALGYGASGRAPRVPPNSILVFTVEVTAVK